MAMRVLGAQPVGDQLDDLHLDPVDRRGDHEEQPGTPATRDHESHGGERDHQVVDRSLADRIDDEGHGRHRRESDLLDQAVPGEVQRILDPRAERPQRDRGDPDERDDAGSGEGHASSSR